MNSVFVDLTGIYFSSIYTVPSQINYSGWTTTGSNIWDLPVPYSRPGPDRFYYQLEKFVKNVEEFDQIAKSKIWSN